MNHSRCRSGSGFGWAKKNNVSGGRPDPPRGRGNYGGLMWPFVEILWPLVTCTFESVAGVASHADTAETAERVGTIGVHVAVSAVFGTLVQI